MRDITYEKKRISRDEYGKVASGESGRRSAFDSEYRTDSSQRLLKLRDDVLGRIYVAG